jgi:hypothetical protein
MRVSINYILLAVMIVLSLLLIGNGITGFVVREPMEFCFSDVGCEEPKVCCLFYEDEKGVCHEANMCGKILQITREQQLSSEELQNILYGMTSDETPIDKEEKLNASYTTQIMFGTLLFIIAVLNVLLYVENRKEPEKDIKKSRS